MQERSVIPRQDMGHRQPRPGDSDYDQFWQLWMARWREDVAERARRAREGGSDVRLLIKAHTDACETCKARNGSEVALNQVPDAPVPDCTSQRGCQCTFTSRLVLP
jgi:hypothetical protein